MKIEEASESLLEHMAEMCLAVIRMDSSDIKARKKLIEVNAEKARRRKIVEEANRPKTPRLYYLPDPTKSVFSTGDTPYRANPGRRPVKDFSTLGMDPTP